MNPLSFLKIIERSIRKRRKQFFGETSERVTRIERSIRKRRKQFFGKSSERVTLAIYFNSLGNCFSREIAQLLQAGLVQAGISCHLRTENDYPSVEAEMHLVVAPHEFYRLGDGSRCLNRVSSDRLLLLNTEPRQTQWFKTALPEFKRARHVFDIDLATVHELERLGYSASHLPLGYVENFAPYDRRALLPITPETEALGPSVTNWIDTDRPLTNRPIDLSFVGESNQRRSVFFARIAPRIERFKSHLRLMPPGSGSRRVEGLPGNWHSRITAGISQRSKIVLNVHRDENNHHFEWHGIVMMGIWQRALVITETVADAPPFVSGVHLVQSSLDELPERIEYYLSDPCGVKEAETIRTAGFRQLKEQLHLPNILKEAFRPFSHSPQIRP